jgi:hypothetical protein
VAAGAEDFDARCRERAQAPVCLRPCWREDKRGLRLIELTRDPLKEIERQIDSSVHDRERIARERLNRKDSTIRMHLCGGDC